MKEWQNIMINTQKNMIKVIGKIAENTLKRDANSKTCLQFINRKFQND